MIAAPLLLWMLASGAVLVLAICADETADPTNKENKS